MIFQDTQKITNVLRPWVLCQDSLTDKLKTIACDVRLEVRHHIWGVSNSWDQDVLGIRANERVLHREILMWASTDICWYARTLLPLSTYLAEEALFARLETQALGELIWHNPNIKRLSIQPFQINQHAAEYHFLTQSMHQNETPLWARLSTLAVRERFPFYLLEIFLPGLIKYL